MLLDNKPIVFELNFIVFYLSFASFSSCLDVVVHMWEFV